MMDPQYVEALLKGADTKEEKETFSYYIKKNNGAWLKEFCEKRQKENPKSPSPSTIVDSLIEDLRNAVEKGR
jgi:hypothetical protein